MPWPDTCKTHRLHIFAGDGRYNEVAGPNQQKGPSSNHPDTRFCTSLLVTRLQVTAGTVNYEGPISIRATSTGAQSTLAGIGRLVAEAQAREAPVQRLADAVAGKFFYIVMAASALTFGFWSLAGMEIT